MKKVLFTQRVEVIENYNERRDCIDQRIGQFLGCCGFLPIAIPNSPELAKEFLTLEDVGGIFLTGGNSLVEYGGNAPERDETERTLVDYAIKSKLPIFGICRGMQLILDYFNVKLESVEGHVKQLHSISGELNREAVNSFHTMAAQNAPEPILVLGRSPDGYIEAIRHESLPIMAIMWHPERNEPFEKEDIELIKGFFER